MAHVLWWVLPAVIPALLLLGVVHFSDTRREPVPLVLTTFFLGGAFGGVAFYLQHLATKWTGLDVNAHVSGDAGALVFIFAFVAPIREAAKTAAMWPAFRSKHFDEPYDGVVYAAASALGFAMTELLRGPARRVWPMITLNPDRMENVGQWMDAFHTRVFGRMDDPQHVRQMDAQKEQLDTLNNGSQFVLREGDYWLRFWIPSIE